MAGSNRGHSDAAAPSTGRAEFAQYFPLAAHMPEARQLSRRQSDVEAWLAALPTRTAGRTPPRPRRGKAPILVGEVAVWEKYRGL